jgi:hypothetical protein
MTDSAISFDELAARLKTAADGELFAINQLELQGARGSLVAPELYRLTVTEARRQAEALGLAHHIARQLASKPEMALGLGFTAGGEVIA